MKRKFLAFDIETAAILTEAQFQNWRSHRPLGMICAAAQPSDAAAPEIWDACALSSDGAGAGRMSRQQVGDFLRYLQGMQEQGYTLLSWNGLGFDWEVIADESDDLDVCRALALDHVDAMFHVHCDRGFPVALARAAEGHRIAGKPAGMSGVLAPQKWASGHYQEVIDYVAQDVRILLEVTIKSEELRSFRWKTQKGTVSSMPLPRGWLTVRDALQMPAPDTSWMSSPIPRERFTEWLGGVATRLT